MFFQTITKKYFSIRERSSRKEYCIFSLILILLPEIAGILYLFNNQQMNNLIIVICVISLLLSVYLIIPSITITIRRLHDINFSGRMFLIFVAFNLLLYFLKLKIISLLLLGVFGLLLLFKKGTAGPNRYGPPPSKD